MTSYERKKLNENSPAQSSPGISTGIVVAEQAVCLVVSTAVWVSLNLRFLPTR